MSAKEELQDAIDQAAVEITKNLPGDHEKKPCRARYAR